MICRKLDFDSAKKAADCLLGGKVAVLPTDTVYGFSGIAGNPDAAEKIRGIKGRGAEKPFIVLIARPQDISLYTEEKIPDRIFSLWPGALTVIVKNLAGAENGTTAFRCPGDEWLRGVIEKCGRPIYSTSVNRSGRPALLTVAEIVEEFGGDVDLIVDDGDRKDALPSTIVRIENGKAEVVRQGEVRV